MKLVLFILSALLSAPAYAAMDCNISSGPGESIIEILVIGQYTTRFEEGTNAKVIYSCGPFVATGAGDAAGYSRVVEIEPDACATLQVSGQNDVIYCRP